MNYQGIEFFNRYTGQIEQEAIYGEKWLRWAYESRLGALARWGLIKRGLFSRWYGWRMDRPQSRAKIMPFIDTYGLDPSAFAEPVSSFRTFNEFFVRRLKPSLRPIDSAANAIVFPADGRHLGFENISAVDAIYAKGQRFDLRTLLASDELARRYDSGSLVISRLCPVDYHRYHWCVPGVASEARLVPGSLESVNPIALSKHISIFGSNRRMITQIDSDNAGRVLSLEVGATCVGSIIQTFCPGERVLKGDQKGMFLFGGSCVITVFEPGKVRLAPDLVEQTRAGRELYAHMGDRLGVAQ
ncbi:MAG TPA: phosphatidylserine decarboxylase [Opitutales bacterium]|nr:phosphatidylserine decarboxylase [Opitutales bacterium]